MYKSKSSTLLSFWTLSIVRHSKEEGFINWIRFRPQVEAWEAPTPLGPLGRVNLRHWTGSLKYRTVDKVQKIHNPKCYTLSSNSKSCESHVIFFSWFADGSLGFSNRYNRTLC
jgi:hypothetical protein